MKTQIKKNFLLLAFVALAFTACKKAEDATNSDNAITQNGAVAIAATESIVGNLNAVKDSVYAVGACLRDHRRTAVKAADLPLAITNYLNANYAGYAFIKAFSTNLLGNATIDSYVVGIIYNGKPVAVKFGADGSFLKVLELREGIDLRFNRDHHDGGCFDDRDGKQRDSLAIANLTQNIKAYMSSNYPSDTLKAAWLTKDLSIILISKNVTFFANIFKLDGTFITRNAIPTRVGADKQIQQSELPVSILSYLNTAYPNYVFKKAFSSTQNGSVKAYLVIVDANLTKYAILFDSNGVLISAKSIR
ncbi:PepSY-like domain-containing protein [Pedobacter sp. SD-b]|uniref:PepSY-like domain-containing protein n=1 Tax=Pedobacter segetis TaxID=2793069 RepID=A0ABS1BGX4_9SPHI|nr:PepSY-like domain-containing protein [Pedobacter segetis]MBK0382129.1 PepSY-like domain-containing protein [Pedobacter segetis]